MKILFYGTKPYDKIWFEPLAEGYGCQIKFLESNLTEETAKLAAGYDGVCVFVNNVVDRPVIDELEKAKVRVILLRCAGYNNVDIGYTKGKMTVLRVPSYSPEAVAEFTMGLILAVNRHIHRAYNLSLIHISVLFELEKDKIILFYKVGREISRWRTMYAISTDGGITFLKSQELIAGDEGGRGPVRNKPIRLSNGWILAPGSTEQGELSLIHIFS